MRSIRGSLKTYAWGSPDAIPRLTETDPDGRPWAEMWFGTHPGGPSTLDDGRALTDLTGPLPFLAKFLAAASPLSLQVHPSEAQARDGYAAEEASGVAIEDPRRVYRDPSAKPEVMIAVTPFRGLCGFRPLDESVLELRACGAGALADRIEAHGYADTVAWLLTERPSLRPDHPTFAALDAVYPGDPGALVATLLNDVSLEPGEAVFLAAGQLHMYLDGLGVEVMGASDNVVRGGLTPKYVDVPELVRIIDPRPVRPSVLRPDRDGWYRLETPVFAVQQLRDPSQWNAVGNELVVFVEADGEHPGGSASVVLEGERADFGGGLAYRITRSHAS